MLILKSESLAELTNDELATIAGAAPASASCHLLPALLDTRVTD